jgi:hypothetical protein
MDGRRGSARATLAAPVATTWEPAESTIVTATGYEPTLA